MNVWGGKSRMDSFEKFASDVLAGYGEHVLERVHAGDKDEVRVALAVNVAHLDCVDNIRVYPLRQKAEFFEQAARGCCGEWNSQVKCCSGRIYWVGCNYGH